MGKGFEVGANDEVFEFVEHVLDVCVRLLFEALEEGLIIFEGLEQLFKILSLLKTIMNVRGMRQNRLVLALFTEWIGPKEIHVARVLQLVFNLIANSIEEGVFKFASEKQGRHGRVAEWIDLPKGVYFVLEEREVVVHPVEAQRHLLDLHFVICQTLVMLDPAATHDFKPALFHRSHQLISHFIGGARITPPFFKEDCFAPCEFATACRYWVIVRLAVWQSLPYFVDDVLNYKAHLGSIVLIQCVDPPRIEVRMRHQENVDGLASASPFARIVAIATILALCCCFTQIIVFGSQTINAWKIALF